MSSRARMLGPARAAKLLSQTRAAVADLEGAMEVTRAATGGRDKCWESGRQQGLHSAVSSRPLPLFRVLAQPSRQLNVHEYQVRHFGALLPKPCCWNAQDGGIQCGADCLPDKSRRLHLWRGVPCAGAGRVAHVQVWRQCAPRSSGQHPSRGRGGSQGACAPLSADNQVHTPETSIL